MEHTKKFVLVDPRFVRPTMRDKALSELDSDISNILNGEDSDEAKAKSYISALARFRNLSAPPKAVKPVPPPPPPPPPQPAAAAVGYKAVRAPQRPHKRSKVETVPSDDPTLWQSRLRTPAKRKLEDQWNKESPKKKKKPRKKWIT